MGGERKMTYAFRDLTSSKFFWPSVRFGRTKCSGIGGARRSPSSMTALGYRNSCTAADFMSLSRRKAVRISSSTNVGKFARILQPKLVKPVSAVEVVSIPASCKSSTFTSSLGALMPLFSVLSPLRSICATKSSLYCGLTPLLLHGLANICATLLWSDRTEHGRSRLRF